MGLEKSHLSVLVVEDNPGDAKLVEHHLDSAVTEQYVDDLSLTHVDTLTAGLTELEAGVFDVVLLDLGLPESTGIETLDRLTDAPVDVPIIVLTGLDDREMAVEAISRGAQDYLPKDDLDSDRLIRALRYAIERHQQDQTRQRQTEQMAFFNQILRHDMLNGMNVIQARGEMLAAELDGEQADFADTIVEWSDDIIDLTEKIRSILGALTGKDSHELGAVELRPVAETAAERARSMGANVAVSVPDGLSVRADPLVTDVLTNLTTNAVEHGVPAGASTGSIAIDITAETAGNRAVVRIADDGQGIDAADRESVFERGYKGQHSGGTGFGLYFVASMVEAYNGAVSVEESDEGGAEFVITLPRARQFG